jgi:hypothetical protein
MRVTLGADGDRSEDFVYQNLLTEIFMTTRNGALKDPSSANVAAFYKAKEDLTKFLVAKALPLPAYLSQSYPFDRRIPPTRRMLSTGDITAALDNFTRLGYLVQGSLVTIKGVRYPIEDAIELFNNSDELNKSGKDITTPSAGASAMPMSVATASTIGVGVGALLLLWSLS